MPHRRSDVLEIIAERSLVFGLSGIVVMALATVLYVYRGDGYTAGLIVVLGLAGATCTVLALVSAFKIRKVTNYDVVCPYCEALNQLTDQPTEDFVCVECQRAIPVLDGQVIPVFQVRCGYCNALNYYNEKTEALICENCDHQIPIATAEGGLKELPRGYAQVDDPNLYELVLLQPGNRTEEVIDTLQRMLALNRNQVKQILEEVPITLLTGITRRKAEMLQAQLTVHEAASEFRVIQ